MSDWQSDLLNVMEDFAVGMEALVSEVLQEAGAGFDRMVERSEEIAIDVADAVTDAVVEVTNEFSSQISSQVQSQWRSFFSTDFSAQTQAFLDTDLEAFLNTLIHPLSVESLEDWLNSDTTLNQYPSVRVKPHPLCADCKNFHGQAYNNVSLVCGMHPYGIAEGQDKCNDREI